MKQPSNSASQQNISGKYGNLKKILTQDTLCILLLLMLFACVIEAWSYGKTVSGIDFYQFWVVGQAVKKADIADVYSDQARKKIGSEFLVETYQEGVSERQIRAAKSRQTLETYSTPLLYTLFGLFATGNYDTDLELFNLFSLFCAVLAIMVLCRLLQYSPLATISAALLVIGWFQPFVSDVRVANVGRLQLALLSLFLWLQSKCGRPYNLGGGLALGFAVMFKPNLMFIVIMLIFSWIINRRWHKLIFECLGILAAAVGLFAYSNLFFGSSRCWYDWLTALHAVPPDIISTEGGNYSTAFLVSGTTGMKVSVYLAAALAVLTAVFVWAGRRPAKIIPPKTSDIKVNSDGAFFEDTLMTSIGCLIYLLSAPLVWFHYFVLTIPMMLVVFRPLRDSCCLKTPGRLVYRTLSVVAVVGLMLDPVVNLFNLTAHRSVAVVVCASALILFVLGLWELERLRLAAKRTTA